ncbi:MAG: hypothetical protein AAGG72_04105 [Pseudomonadota bacterium]
MSNNGLPSLDGKNKSPLADCDDCLWAEQRVTAQFPLGAPVCGNPKSPYHAMSACHRCPRFTPLISTVPDMPSGFDILWGTVQ